MLAMLRTIITDPAVSIERVNLAFDFYQRVEAAAAKKAFDAAMADAKAEFGPIVKRHLVSYGEAKDKTEYKHEDLADISEVVDPILAKHGLYVKHDGTSNLNEPISVTCIVTHRLGYSEKTTLKAGADSSGKKNSIQAIGSTLTYLQRYTKRLALGLSPRKDDDGRSADNTPEDDGVISDEQATTLRGLITATETKLSNFLAVAKAESVSDILAAEYPRLHQLLLTKQGKMNPKGATR
jgi:hypothetical protein